MEDLYKKYNNATWFWVQEEPLNMGAASFLQMNLKRLIMESSAGSQVLQLLHGFGKVHAQEQEEIIDTAFSI